MIVGLQLLRYVAAVLVVVTHALGEYQHLTKIGGFGVDIFFVISGFIVVYITQNDVENFLVKRIVRIVPLYWFFSLAIFAIAFFRPELTNTSEADPNLLLHSLFFIPYWTASGGFNPILTLGWTLNFEVAFYAIFYVSSVVSHRHRAIITTFLIFLMCGVAYLIPKENDSFVLFYQSSLWLEFILGMLLAELYRRKSLSTEVILIIALGFISFLVLWITDFYLDDFPLRGIILGVPALGVVAAVLATEQFFSTLPSGVRRVFLWLGDISYPLYLVHIYVIAFFSRIAFPEIGFITLLLVTNLVAFFVCYVVLRWIDIPLRRYLIRKFT